jgi:fatty-acyl-CoA synthase
MTPAYVHGSSTVPLIGETIGAVLNDMAERYGDRLALISCHQDLRYTYAELRAEVDRAARAFLDLGVNRGDRIGIWSANAAEWVVTQYAAAKVGAILVNVNPAYRLRELEYALGQSGLRVLVTARAFRSTSYLAMLSELIPELAGSGRGTLRSTRFPCLERVIFLGPGPPPGGVTWSQFLEAGDAVAQARLAEREALLQFDDPVNIQYTSGTTGSPKGATLSHHNILNNGFFVGEMLRYTPDDRVCVPVPFYHCFGCVMGNLAALTHGASIVIPAATFDAEDTLRAIEKHRCTSIYGVPTMFIAELDHPSFETYRLHTLRTGIMAGAPCPIEVMRQVIDRMHVSEVTICYGMTETSPVSFQSAVDDPIEARVSTVGRVHPHLECKIVDPATGAVVPRGTTGELCTRGYSVMLGYWNNPEATAASIDAANWMHTGDLAIMREDGYVQISGRSKDMIIRGGENIYPREVEEFLYTHPKISEVQVIGVPDGKYGEEVCAWVRLRENTQATTEEFQAFCSGQIATYKIPRYFRFTNEFPTTVTGKIQKYKMREISVHELGLADN